MTSPSESSLFEVPNDIADRAIIDQATTADMRAATRRRQQIGNRILAVGGIQLMSQNLREGSENASEFNVARDDPRRFGARDGAERAQKIRHEDAFAESSIHPPTSLIEVPNDIADRSIIDQARTRDYLTNGYISYSFTSRNAEFYVVCLFKRDAASVQAICDRNGAYSVFIPPSYFSPPIRTEYGDTWVLDYAVRTGGSVVPQQLLAPRGQDDRRRYVDQVRYHMPIFFVNMNGSLGVPVMNAAAGHMHLRDAYLPPSLINKRAIKIHMGWPGYAPSQHQVPLTDQTPARNPIGFDRFVKYVGSRVRQFLMDCERSPVQKPFGWMSQRASGCPSSN
ncbi:hypothetical protein V8E52_003800 [Russula decolorans]